MPELAGAVSVRTEFDALERVAVCAPTHFFPTPPINARQEAELRDGPPIDGDRLAEEHAGMVAALAAHGVETVDLAPEPDAPYMLNARDPAFVVGSRLFVSRMRVDVRQMEPASVEKQLRSRGLVDDAAVVALDAGFLEGGDVIVDGGTVLCGVGERTDSVGAAGLADAVRDEFAVMEVPLADGVLHLDTAVGLAPGLALVWPDGLAEPASVLRYLESRGDVVTVNRRQRLGFATNYLLLGPTRALLPAGLPRVAELLAARGIEATEVAFDEHHRSGGSIRCATMPLRRTKPG